MPAHDPFIDGTSALFAPFTYSVPVTPNDGADLTEVTRSLMVTVAGDVAVTYPNGTQDVLPGLQVGTVYPFRVARIHATGTTATGIKACY